MALSLPNYDDAVLHPVTSAALNDVPGDEAADGDTGDRGHGAQPGDTLPSYDTACFSADRFHLTSSSSSSSSRGGQAALSHRDPFPGTGAVVSQLPKIPTHCTTSTTRPSSQSGVHDVTAGDVAEHVHGVTIQVTRLEEAGGQSTGLSPGPGGGPDCGSSHESRDAGQGNGRSSPARSGEAECSGVTGACGGSAVSQAPLSTSHSAGAVTADPSRAGSHRLELLQDPLRCSSGGFGRRTSDTSQRSCLVPGQRSQRSCSDAGIHEESRTRAAAAAGPRRSSSLLPAPQHGAACCQHHHCHHHHHHHHYPHHQQHQLRSHSCIPVHQMGSSSSVHNGHSSGRRSHSHSSISRLAATRGGGGHRERCDSLCGNQHSSRHPSSEDEEVTYVWKDNRVQVHHTRSDLTTPDLSVSGQHVQYIWRNGNVQRVVRGSNHEVLSAEVVPPREIKGLNYCTVFGLMAFFVIAIVTLIFVFRIFY